jgi:type IX secretion system PorP/SprF family membrane protein
MKKYLLPVLLILFLSWSVVFAAKAQQDPLYTLYLNNPLTINPAYTGLNNNFNAVAGFRKQWAGFDGNPTTLSMTAHSSLRENTMGAGVIVVSDKIGENTTTQFAGTYAYKIEISHDRILSFGMQGGFMNYRSDPGKLNLQDPNDPVFAPISQIKPIIGAGVMLKSERYLFGLSIPRLLNSSFNVGGQNFKIYQQNYYLFGCYIFTLSERILLKPCVLLKAVKGSPVSADVNFNVNIDRNYTVGVYTRNLNSYGLLTQLNFLNYYRLAYAFEVPTNKSVGARFTTNEINLGIKLSILHFHDRLTTNF